MLLQRFILLLIASFAIARANCQQDPPVAADSQKSTSHSWSYEDQKGWSEEYPECGMSEEKRQSPINIITDNVVIKPEYELFFIDYNQPIEFQLRTNHHTISATPISLTKPSLKLNWLPEVEFELKEIHFHWGDGNFKGSEHEINGQKAAAEMHMVHIRKGLTKEDIGNVDDSVVVIGVFIESDSEEHTQIDNLIDHATYINGTESEYVTNDSSHLLNLLPSMHTFYTYNGSLTTPPCYEVVTWVMMSQPVFMQNQRLIEMSNLAAVDSKGVKFKIKANFRDIQGLGDRKVFASFRTEELISPEYKLLQRNEHNSTTRTNRFRVAFEEFWRKIRSTRF